MSNRTISFIGGSTEDHYSRVWFQNAQELGYLAKLNDINGLTKNDVVIYDKFVEQENTETPAYKVCLFPDVFSEDIQSEYLNTRMEMLRDIIPLVDMLIIPPNPSLLSFVRKTFQIPVYGMNFGVYTTYLSFVRPRLPDKKNEVGFCWLPFSERRTKIKQFFHATQVHGFGREMIDGMRPFRYMLNAHYTEILNNEQRLTEIPLSLSIPVSEELADPKRLSDLHIVSLKDYVPNMYGKKEYKKIVRHNLRTVYEKYNSRNSLQQILSVVFS
jgi:hypothetical protein